MYMYVKTWQKYNTRTIHTGNAQWRLTQISTIKESRI